MTGAFTNGSSPRYSACVPCCNNAPTLRAAVESVLEQTVPPAEVVVVDDGSRADSIDTLRGLPVRLIRHDHNLGRGAVRVRAMAETKEPLVLCCDATLALDREFAARALPWFFQSDVAAVFGVFEKGAPHTATERWRERHLFKVGVPRTVQRDASLATGGAVLRRTSVAAAGGFDSRLRHSEDADLGRRLLARGDAVVCDPSLRFSALDRNSVGEVLERYWRWHAGAEEHTDWRGYLRLNSYALKVMARADLAARDPLAAAISLACPHYQFWKSRLRRRAGRETR